MLLKLNNLISNTKLMGQCASYSNTKQRRNSSQVIVRKQSVEKAKDKNPSESTEFSPKEPITLSAKFMTILPSFLDGESSKYRIRYEVYYGETCEKWIEEANSTSYISQRTFDFDYNIVHDDQKVYVKITFDIKKSKIAKEASLDHSYIAAQEEDLIPDEFGYFINTRYDLHEVIMLKGGFGTAEYLNSNIPRDSGEPENLKGLEKYEHDTSIIR